MTALLGLPAYLELLHASGLRESVERHVGLRECGQGWTDNQIVTSLMLLNLAGGESVVDLEFWTRTPGSTGCFERSGPQPIVDPVRGALVLCDVLH